MIHEYSTAGLEEPAPTPKKKVNYDDEVLWREFSPSQKDLLFNVALAPTLVWIPFTVAAIGRCTFVKYRITDKRIIVKTEAPWKSAILLCSALPQ